MFVQRHLQKLLSLELGDQAINITQKPKPPRQLRGAGDLSMLMISTVSLVSFNRVGGGLNFTPWNVQ
jgi:hypothetical protein